MRRRLTADLLAGFILRFRIPIIVLTVFAVAVFAVAVCFFTFENDLTFWVDKSSAIGALPHYVSERFGGNSPLLIAVKTDDVFTRDNLLRLKTFCEALRDLPAVKSVYALPTADDVEPTASGIRVKKLIPDPLPETPEALAAVKAHVLSLSAGAGRLVSADGTATLIAISLHFGKSDKTAAAVRTLAEKTFAGSGAALYFSGNTFILNSMSDIVLADFAYLIPLVSVLVVIVLFLSFRTARGVALPLLTVIISTVIAMGVMAALGVPLNVMSSAMPVILVAVGSAYGIHILNHYYEYTGTHREPDKREMTASLIRCVWVPVAMAGLTTMAGFISNISAEVSIIRTFGVFTSIGVGLAVLVSLVFIPALLSFLPFPRRRLTAPTDDPARPHPAAEKAAGFILRFRGVIIGAFIGTAALAAVFALRITPKVDILGYFAEDSEPRVASRFINDNFGGFNPLSVYLKGDAADPDVLKTLLILEERIKASGRLTPPAGLADVVVELNRALTGFATVPETKAEVENLLFFVQGGSMVEGLVTEDRKETLVTVLLPSMDNVYLEGLFTEVEDYLAGFRNGIAVVPNDPASPAFRRTAAVFLEALFKGEHVEYAKESLDGTVRRLSEKAASFREAPDFPRAAAYAASDEAEIIMEADEIKRLVRELRASVPLTRDAVGAAVHRALSAGSGAAEDQIDAFARSLFQLLNESADKRKLGALAAALTAEFPGLEQTHPDRLNRALSCFLWKTVPVPHPSSGAPAPAPVRITPVERFEMTGTAKLVEDIRRNTFINQLLSILIALTAVFLLNTVTFRSFREGLVSLAGITFTIIVNFGVMGLVGIPLDFVTAIIAGVAIGAGIDYTIHFISRFTRELQSGKNEEAAFAHTLAGTGRAILFNALSVALGFSVLLFSNVVPLRSAGILLASTMATSSLAALTLMPAILAATRITERIVARHARRAVRRRPVPVRGTKAEEAAPGGSA